MTNFRYTYFGKIDEKHCGEATFFRQQEINPKQVVYYLKGQQNMQVKGNSLLLDKTDLGILKALQEDARQTYTAIGKRLGLAHSTVYDRIKKMEQSGIIMKYTALVDTEKLGTKNIMALMTVYTDPKESEKVAEKLSEASQILEVYTSLSEELVILTKVIAENQERLHEFIADYVAPLPGVLRIRTSIITKRLKEEQLPMFDGQEKLLL